MNAQVWFSAAVLAAVFAGQGLSQSLSSSVLTDSIVGGAGHITLLKDVNAVSLEAYRAANGNQLVFGVDVHEHTASTEKPSSQAVAVQSAWLEITFANGAVKSYGNSNSAHFSTETQALLIPTGSSQRSAYYTLLGDQDQVRAEAKGTVQSTFDSTLHIPVTDNLTQAVSAVLHVQLLNTDVGLRDPEAFYDYSDAPERVALLSPEDARYLDQRLPLIAAFRQQAPGMELSLQGQQTLQALIATGQISAMPPASLSWMHYPGTNSYYQSAFQDSYPLLPDYDYNDAVVSYHYQLGLNEHGAVERIDGMAYLISQGSNYSHDWYLDLPLSVNTTLGQSECSTVNSDMTSSSCQISLEGSNLRWRAFTNTRTLLTPMGASKTAVPHSPHAHFSVKLSTPVQLSLITAALPWLHVRETGQDITTSLRDSRGYPAVIIAPRQWHVVQEGVDMGLAYPELSDFIASSGARHADWYLHPNTQFVQYWGQNDWEWEEL